MSSQNANPPTMVGDLASLVHAGYRYRTVLADPPWDYSNRASRGAAANHYPTMTIDEIKAEPVEQLVEESAHLHLWTTNAFLEASFAIIRSWGFEYKSCLVWVKPQLGMGNYWRISHEFCLFAIRGKQEFRRNDIQSWVLEPRRGHSVKTVSISPTHRSCQSRSLP